MTLGSRWTWPLIIAASACLAALGMAGVLPAPLRVVAAFWFLSVCPGMAFVRLLHLESALARWTLAVALSLGLEAALAELLALTGRYSPAAALLALVALSLVGALMQLRPGPRLTPGVRRQPGGDRS